MYKYFFGYICLGFLMITGCDGGGSGQPDIPAGFNLLNSDCPGEDIVAIPVSEGYVWECIIIETGQLDGGATLDSRSQAGCFETRSRGDAFCGIEVLGRASFAASHHEFNLEDPPPPDAEWCDPAIAVSIEEVECRIILLP
jgi:hypothetical protein